MVDTYIYHAIIYEHITDCKQPTGIYDVFIYHGRNRKYYLTPYNRKIVYFTRVVVRNNLQIKHITGYFRWKFLHCQKSYDSYPICRKNGVFTYINNNLPWVRSIVDAEINFHLGDKSQMCDPKNTQITHEYLSSDYAGYGYKSSWKR